MITAEQLNELMREQKPYISYDSSLASEFLEIPLNNIENLPDEIIVDYFADYILSQGLEDEVEE